MTVAVSERFWSRVKRGDEDACWLWQGYVNRRGYGRLSHQGESSYAHRVAWELTHDAIPPGMVVRHACDNPPCVNPAHLLLGSQADNMRDKKERGRSRGAPPGENHPKNKLTEEQVREIRVATGSCREIAIRYGVSKSTIVEIRAGLTWRHLI